jgi:DNA-binding transcriptional LysR family regulator
VKLTLHGERLLVHARTILHHHDEAVANISGAELSGTLRFGCPDDYASAFLPEILRGFAGMHPQVFVEVFCAPTPRLEEQLKAHLLDLALISISDAEDDANVIRREPLVWVGNQSDDAAGKEPLQLALSHPDTLDYRAACAGLESIKRTYRIAYASSNISGLLAVVRSGQAVAVLTSAAVPADLKILQPGPLLPRLPTVGLTVRFDLQRPSSLAVEFSDHLRRLLPGL